MTLQIMSDHVYTQLGVAISVTGIAQARSFIYSNRAFLYVEAVLFCECKNFKPSSL